MICCAIFWRWGRSVPEPEFLGWGTDTWQAIGTIASALLLLALVLGSVLYLRKPPGNAKTLRDAAPVNGAAAPVAKHDAAAADEQRRSEVRPHVELTLLDWDAGGFSDAGGGAVYPSWFDAKMINVGTGPALAVSVRYEDDLGRRSPVVPVSAVLDLDQKSSAVHRFQKTDLFGEPGGTHPDTITATIICRYESRAGEHWQSTLFMRLQIKHDEPDGPRVSAPAPVKEHQQLLQWSLGTSHKVERLG